MEQIARPATKDSSGISTDAAEPYGRASLHGLADLIRALEPILETHGPPVLLFACSLLDENDFLSEGHDG